MYSVVRRSLRYSAAKCFEPKKYSSFLGSKMYSSPSKKTKSTPTLVSRSFMWWASSISRATPEPPSLALTNGSCQRRTLGSWSAMGRVS